MAITVPNIKAGETYKVEFTVKYDSVAQDITTDEVHLYLKHPQSQFVILDKQGDVSGGDSGLVVFLLDDTETADLIPDVYFMLVEWLPSTGGKYSIHEQYITVKRYYA